MIYAGTVEKVVVVGNVESSTLTMINFPEYSFVITIEITVSLIFSYVTGTDLHVTPVIFLLEASKAVISNCKVVPISIDLTASEHGLCVGGLMLRSLPSVKETSWVGEPTRNQSDS